MPLTLIHGPAGSGKTDHLLEEFLKNRNSQLICEHQDQIDKLAFKAIKKSSSEIIDLRKIQTWEDWQWQKIKENSDRAHKLDRLSSRNIIRKCLSQKKSRPLHKFLFYSTSLLQIEKTIQLFKKNLMNPATCREKLKDFINAELEDFLYLFEDYQKEIQSKNYYDQSEIKLKFYELLQKDKLQFGIDSIFITNIFPFDLGQRQTLRLLLEKFPKINFYLSHSFDHKNDEDPYLYPSYTELGQLANQNIYYDSKQKNSLDIYCFSDPVTEINTLVSELQKLSENELHQSTILVPQDQFYIERLLEACFEANIDLNCKFQIKNHKYGSFNQNYIKDFLEKPNFENKKILWEEALSQNFETYWSFQEEEFKIPKENSTNWKIDEKNLTFHKKIKSKSGLQIRSLSEAHLINSDFLFIIGYTEDKYPEKPAENYFINEKMFQSSELREILLEPQLEAFIQKEKLKQALRRSKKNYASYPLFSLDGREKKVSQLHDKLKITHTIIPKIIKSGKTNEKTTDLNQVKYQKIQKKSFSITELETYQKCPYKYYSQKILKVKVSQEDKELPADIIGRFIHHVLENLFKENLELYKEALNSEDAFQKLLSKLDQIIKYSLQSYKNQISQYKETENEFIKRAKITLEKYLYKEKEQINEAQKKTLPAYFEWSFGRGQSPALQLKKNDNYYFIAGRVDRIDIDEDRKNFTVIDYKTGELDTGPQILRAESLQIPIYLMAVQDILLKDFRPSVGCLLGLKDLKKQNGLAIKDSSDESLLSKRNLITKDQWLELRKKVESTCIQIIEDIHAGQFDPSPISENMCSFCDYKDMCDWRKN